MAHARECRHEPPDGVVRPGGAAGRRGDDDAGPLPVASRVTVYHAPGCGLCSRAIDVAAHVAAEVGAHVELVDIEGVPELEQRYRALLPVVEVDGELAFSYFVDADALRARLGAVPPAGAEPA